MQRIRKILAIAAISVMTVCTVPVQAENGGASDTIQIQPVTVKKSGFIKEGTKYFFYDKKGNKLKSKWKTIQKRRYYFKADGTAAVGGTKIGKYTYVFDLQGRLLKPSKSKIVQVGKQLYYVNKKGQAIKGFFKIGNKLYRGDIKGRLTKNKTVANVTFNSKGYAKNDLNAKLKMKLMTIISRITTTEMSKSEKLYSCWRYLTSSGNFYYSTYWPDLNKKGWQREVAYNMLTTGGGDCYGFACTFAAMARELGYNPYVVLGRVSGTRDGAADGLTRHGWVMIDGAYYDPEAQFAGWYRGVYGNGSYDISHTISRYIRYAS